MRKLMLTLCLVLFTVIAKGAGNHLSVHYNNTSYRFSGFPGASDNNFSLNGVGIGYDYQWCPENLLDEGILFFADQALKVNYDFGNPDSFSNRGNSLKMKMQDLNLQYVENLGYMFNVYDDEFFIAPYIGLNLRYHLLTRAKLDGDNQEWMNFYSKEDMGADGKWKRFQIGWQVGLDFTFSCPIFMRVQYGTDFIANYSYKKDGYKEKIKSGHLQVSLGYYF